MSDLNSTLLRRQLGRAVREGRTALAMSMEALAKLSDVSSSALQRFEKGESTRVKARDLQAICEVLEMPEESTETMITLLQHAKVKDCWHDFDLIPAMKVYYGLETAAEKLTTYQPSLVPGILQIPDYARTLIRLALPDETPEEHERRLAVRMHRQASVKRKRQPKILDVVLHETVLRTVVGSPKLMARQLRYLADISTQPNVTIRVLPFSAGVPLGTGYGQFIILAFGVDAKGRLIEPPAVYQETITGCTYMEKPEDLAQCYRAHEAIQHASLDEMASRSLLRQAAREYHP